MKLMIIGGYGAFGGRLAGLLSDLPMEILIGGRNLAKAVDFCQRQHGHALYTAVKLDRTEIHSALETHRPDIVVDASGPFQLYGDDPYGVVKACITTHTHYLDLADACLLYTSPSPRDATLSRMPSSA